MPIKRESDEKETHPRNRCSRETQYGKRLGFSVSKRGRRVERYFTGRLGLPSNSLINVVRPSNLVSSTLPLPLGSRGSQEEGWGLKTRRVSLLNQGILSTISSFSPENAELCPIILLCSLSLGRKWKNSSLETRPRHTDLWKLLVKSLPHSLFSLLDS